MNTEPEAGYPPRTRRSGIGPLSAVRMVRLAGADLFDQAGLHAQLAHVEVQQEQRRLLRILALGALGLACLVSLLLSAGALVLAASWDGGYRLQVAIGLVVLYACALGLCWRRLRRTAAADAGLFRASIEELSADAAMLRKHL